jgi:DNA primase
MIFSRRIRKKSFFVFNQLDINKVFNKVTNHQVISDFVILKKTGKDFTGRCPFCRPLTKNSKHFRVSKKHWKCFECGAGGTKPISFLMRYFDVAFDKALRYMNKMYCKDVKLTGSIKENSCRDEYPF